MVLSSAELLHQLELDGKANKPKDVIMVLQHYIDTPTLLNALVNATKVSSEDMEILIKAAIVELQQKEAAASV